MNLYSENVKAYTYNCGYRHVCYVCVTRKARQLLCTGILCWNSFKLYKRYGKWDLQLDSAHLKTDAAFIMTRVRSALVFSLKPFVKTNITHITMEWLVFVYPKKTKQNQQLFPTATDLIISRKLHTNKKNTLSIMNFDEAQDLHPIHLN